MDGTSTSQVTGSGATTDAEAEGDDMDSWQKHPSALAQRQLESQSHPQSQALPQAQVKTGATAKRVQQQQLHQAQASVQKQTHVSTVSGGAASLRKSPAVAASASGVFASDVALLAPAGASPASGLTPPSGTLTSRTPVGQTIFFVVGNRWEEEDRLSCNDGDLLA